MSGIGSIGLSQDQNLVSGMQSGRVSHGRPPGPPPQHLDSRLEDALTAAGIDQETADSLKADLKAAFEEQFSSESSPPEPGQLKQMTDEIFAEYGLDAEAILGAPPHGSGGPLGKGLFGSPPETAEIGGLIGSTEMGTDTMQSVLELLQTIAQQEPDSSVDAQTLIHMLFGVDELV